MRLMEWCFTDNDCIESRRNAINTIKHRATSEHWDDSVLLFAPEGTTSNGTAMCQFKKPFLPGHPVQPFVVEFPEWYDYLKNSIFPSSKSDQVRSTTRGSGWMAYTWDFSPWVILYHLSCLWQPMIVTVLPLYVPDEDEKNDAVLFARNVRQKMAKGRGRNMRIMNTNRYDGCIVSHFTSKFDKNVQTKKELYEKLDEYLIFGEDLEKEFGTKMIERKELLAWADEFDGQEEGRGKAKSLHAHIVGRLEEKKKRA